MFNKLYKNAVKLFILNLLFIFFTFGCQKAEAPAKKNITEIIPVRVSKVVLLDVEEEIDYVGDIKAKNEAIVYPKVTGKVIEKIKQEGDVVKKGDIIAYIDRDEVGLKFEKAAVESTLDGFIGKVFVDNGASVTPQTQFALIVDMREVKIILDIPDNYLSKIFLKQEALVFVDAYPQEEFKGSVVKISPVVNLDNRSAPVEIVIDNPEYRLKSGMFARVRLAIDKHPLSAVILKEAVIGKGLDTYVYLVEDGKAVLRKVSLGMRSGPLYEVTQGVKAGDLVVIMGQQRLYDGAPVKFEIDDSSMPGGAR